MSHNADGMRVPVFADGPKHLHGWIFGIAYRFIEASVHNDASPVQTEIELFTDHECRFLQRPCTKASLNFWDIWRK